MEEVESEGVLSDQNVTESYNITQEEVKFQEDLATLMTIVPYLVPILFSLIIIVGSVGNILVVLVVSLNKTMRNNTNILILNLAVSDLLFLLFCVPFTAADYALTSVWYFGELWCKLNQTIIVCTAYVSIYTLVLMATDRYLAVVFPVSSKTIRTNVNTQIAIALGWGISLVFSSPAFFLHGLVESRAKVNQYQCSFTNDSTAFMVFQGSFFVLSYFLPLVLIVCLYSVMLHTLWYKTSAGGHMSRESMKNKKRVVTLVTMVTLMFSISWLPIQLILLLKAVGMYKVTIVNISIQIASHILAYSNSCINPILYAFLSPSFRAGFRKVLTCVNPHLNPANGNGVNNDHCIGNGVNNNRPHTPRTEMICLNQLGNVQNNQNIQT